LEHPQDQLCEFHASENKLLIESVHLESLENIQKNMTTLLLMIWGKYFKGLIPEM
jgi:hypothetical protein